MCPRVPRMPDTFFAAGTLSILVYDVAVGRLRQARVTARQRFGRYAGADRMASAESADCAGYGWDFVVRTVRPSERRYQVLEHVQFLARFKQGSGTFAGTARRVLRKPELRLAQ